MPSEIEKCPLLDKIVAAWEPLSSKLLLFQKHRKVSEFNKLPIICFASIFNVN